MSETEKKELVLQLVQTQEDYLVSNKLADFDAFPVFQKLAISQKIDKRYIKKRSLGGVNVPYISHQTAEKILNFVFNFRASNEVLSTDIVESASKKTFEKSDGTMGVKDAIIYEASALVKFTFTYPDGTTITRTVLGTHLMAQNKALPRQEAIKSAISKSWTIVARTFGIGSDLEQKENEAYKRADKYTPPKDPVHKSHSPY